MERRRLLASLGVEINLIAKDHFGADWYVEVSGAFTSKRPGLVRTDTVRKVLGSASLLSKRGFSPFIVLTTHLPRPGSAGHQWIHEAGPGTIFDIIVLGSKKDFQRLRKYSEIGFDGGALPGWWSEEELSEEATAFDFTASAGIDTISYLSPEGLKVTSFGHYVELLIPSRDRDGRSLDPVQIATVHRDLVKWLADRNGGLFSQQVNGAWLDEQCRQVDENLISVRSWSGSAVESFELEPLIARMLEDLDQESICAIVDGQMLIYSKQPEPVRIPT